MLWIAVILLLLSSKSANSRPIDRKNEVREKLCRIGNASLPLPVFESYAGWECYEETFREMKELEVHVCVERTEDAEYTVPCFKSNGSMLSFNLKNEESVLAILEASGSRKLNDEMIRCYLSVVAACETSSDGWLGLHFGCRFFVGNTTGGACGLEGQSKFHIAMLSISLIIAIPVVIIFLYCTLCTKSVVLFHSRNLIVALIVRTFFSLLIETEVISQIIQSPEVPIVNWAGCEALASFETIALNLVLAYWLILTFYLFESSKSMFHGTPDIRKGSYIVLGLAVTFPIIWIIIMAAGGYGNCWLERTPVQWVNDALRLGFILVQIFLTSFVFYRVVTELKGPVDNYTRLLARNACGVLFLSPLFLLQFSLSASHPLDPEEGEAHIYTEFFFDGLQCAVVSVVNLYIFCSVISDFEFIVNLIASCFKRNRQCERVFETTGGTEVEIGRGDAPPRIAKVQSPATNVEDEERKDITYTSILTPERFERTIKLYNRLNNLPKAETFEEVLQDNSSVKSEYFDVDNESVKTVYNEVINQNPEDAKNRYYTSRYLVQDSDSSQSEESVLDAIPEVIQRLPTPSSSSSSIVLPTQEVDSSREIEEWLANCRSEFQDYAEKAMRNKSATPTQNTIHRSLSGSIFSGSEIPGSVKVHLKTPPKSESVRAKKGSAPSLILSEEEETTKKKESLPSIYDDLKEYSRSRNAKTTGKKNYNASWANYRNRVLNKRRKVKSLDDLDPLECPIGELSPQLNALLSPSCINKDFEVGSLQKYHFSGMEDLTQFSDNKVSDHRTEKLLANDGESQKVHSVEESQSSEVTDVKI